MIENANSQDTTSRVLTLVARIALLAALSGGLWFVYQDLPHDKGPAGPNAAGQTTVQIVLRRSAEMRAQTLVIPVELSPIDLVAARHEYKVEPRPGKSFDQFARERMNGRREIKATLDSSGRTEVRIPHGQWWLHAVLTGEEDLEWWLQLNIQGERQTIELSLENVYTRSKSF